MSRNITKQCPCEECRKDSRTLYNNLHSAAMDWEAHMVKRRRSSAHVISSNYHVLKIMVAELAQMSLELAGHPAVSKDILADMANWCDELREGIEG